MAGVKDLGTAVEFPQGVHGETWEAPNGLTYEYCDQDDDGNLFKEGHWTLVGQKGPIGPSGNPGRAGTDGRYPTIDVSTGQWIYNWSDVDKEGEAIDQATPSNYPAQGVLRLKGIVGDVGALPLSTRADMGDCYFVSDDSTAGNLHVIVWHDERDENGVPIKDNQVWANMGQLGLEGPNGPKGPTGGRGPTGKALCEVVDVLPTGAWEPGTIYMEKNTNHLFIAIEPQGVGA